MGRDRSGLFRPGVEEYERRLARFTPVKLIELPEAKTSGARAKSVEAQAIVERLGPRDRLVALDERGKSMTSVAFAQWLERQLHEGVDLAFAVGGDDGLGEELLARAALTLSLSPMTLPHRLARLVLLEQLYRAFSILRGAPYHRA